MTRYWTPTRATYFDHVSKARIAEVVSAAVSPKVAADLGKMKRVDAAAAAELRLAKVAWVPEILTDREIPAAPTWTVREDEDDSDIRDGIDLRSLCARYFLQPLFADSGKKQHKFRDAVALLPIGRWAPERMTKVLVASTDPDWKKY